MTSIPLSLSVFPVIFGVCLLAPSCFASKDWAIRIIWAVSPCPVEYRTGRQVQQPKPQKCSPRNIPAVILPSQCLRNHTFIWNTDEVRHGGGFIQAVEKYFSVITSYLTCFVSVRATCVACVKLWFILHEVTNISNLELIKCQKCTFKHKWLNIYGWHIFLFE